MEYHYEVRVSGRMSRTLMAEFAELQLESSVEHVQTVLHGDVQDQAALYGLLRRLEALGLDLVEVRRRPIEKGARAGRPQSSSS